MSTPPSGYNTDVSFNRFKGTYFNDDIDVSGGDIISRSGNLYLADNSSIFTSANQIQFNEEFQFTDFVNNVNVLGQLKHLYNSVSYDVGLQCEKADEAVADLEILSPIVSDNTFKLTNMYYDSALNTTIFSNNVSFGNGTIASIAINNSDNRYMDTTSNQTVNGTKTIMLPVFPVGSIPINRISGTAVNTNGAQNIVANKTFTVLQNFQSIRVDGGIAVNNNSQTITNAQLQLIPDISTLKNLTSAITYTSSTLTTVISNVLQFSGTLNGWNTINFSNAINYARDLTSSAQTQIESLQTQINNFSGVSLSASNVFVGPTNQFTNTLRLDGALNLNANALIIPNSTMQKLQYCSTISSDIQIQTTTNATNINEGKDNLTILNTKNTDISYASYITTVVNTLATANITFSGNLNTIPSATFAFINSLTSNAQAQLTNLATKLTAISYESANTTTTIAGDVIFLNNLNSISATTFGYLTGLSGAIQTQLNSLSTSITTLNDLTAGFTRSSTTGTYTFSSNLNTSGNFNTLTPYEIGNLTGTTANIQTSLNSKMDYFAGTIVQHAQASLQSLYPTRFLLCNGQEVSRSTFNNLFTIIGSSYGIGNGSTTFNVPDYRACFLRMYSSARTVNGVVYSPNLPNVIQEDTLEEHEHHSNLSGNYLRSGTNTNSGYLQGALKPNQSDFPAHTGGVTSTNRSSSESRPLNYSVYFYITC